MARILAPNLKQISLFNNSTMMFDDYPREELKRNACVGSAKLSPARNMDEAAFDGDTEERLAVQKSLVQLESFILGAQDRLMELTRRLRPVSNGNGLPTDIDKEPESSTPLVAQIKNLTGMINRLNNNLESILGSLEI